MIYYNFLKTFKMTSPSIECKATTKSGERCKRNATKNGYCTQHFEINEQALPSDIMKNIISDYIPYEELKELENNIQNLKINKGRVIKKKKKFKNGNYIITTKIDGKKRKEEGYLKNNMKASERNYNINEQLDGYQFDLYINGKYQHVNNYKDGKLNGTQFAWYENGNKQYELNYKDNNKDGLQLSFWENGNKEYEHNYSQGKQRGIQREYDEDGKLINRWYK
jgi:antitoxin component YwqK of YwqJK toxin-antitoxin module